MKATNDLKRITEFKELLEIIKHKIDMMEVKQSTQSASIGLMRDQLSVMNSKLDSHSGSLITIEKELKAYADMYKINDSNIRKMEKRLETVEKDAGIKVNPEHQLANVS